MARKASSGKTAQEQQTTPDLGVELSMADFESMISDAAQELADEQKALEEAPAIVAKPAVSKANKASPAPAPAQSQVNPPRAANVEIAPVSIPSAANDPKKGRTFDPFGRKASSGVYWAALIVSALWVAGGYFIATRVFGSQIFNVTTASSVLSRPNLIATLIAIIVPIIGFWSFAVLVRRAQEMRIAAQSLTDVAYRLVDPESLAEERLTTISQAVRREVAAMSEGIDRTLSRAVELESLLHSEVNELERAYSDNEGRMRGLLDGLGNERQSIIGQAERVRTTLAGAREQLNEELTQAVETLRTGVAAASSDLSITLDQSRTGLLASLQETGNDIEARIAERTNALNTAVAAASSELSMTLDLSREGILASLQETGTEVETRIAERTIALNAALAQSGDNLAAIISSRSGEISGLLDTQTNAFAGLIDSRTDTLSSMIESRSDALANMLDTRSSAFIESGETASRMVADALDAKALGMVASLNSATEALTTQFDGRLASVEANLVTRGQQIIDDLDAKTVSLSDSTERLNSALDARARQINETLGERSREIAETFTAGRDSFSGLIADGKESLAEELQGFVISAGTVIDDSADRLARRVADIRGDLESNLVAEVDRVEATLTQHRDTFAGRLDGFEDTFAARTHEFDQRISAHAIILDESISKKSIDLDVKIAGHVSKLNQAMDEQAVSLAQTISSTVVDFESTLASRVADLRRTVEDGSSTLESSVNSAADRLAATLDSQTADFNSVVARRSAELASTINAQTADFDNVVAERSAELAATLGARGLEIESAIDSATNRASAAFEGKTDYITAQTAAMEHALQLGMEGVGKALDSSSRAAGETLRNAVREATTSLYTQASEASQLLGDRQQDLAVRLTTAIESTENVLATSVGNLEATFNEGQTRIAGRAEELGNRLGDLENVFERADQRIIMRTHKTSEELNARAEAIGAALETFDTSLTGRLTGLEATVTLKADATVARIEEASRVIERSAAESGSIIEQRARELSTSLASHSTEIARILQDTGEPLVASIATGGEAFRARLEEATKDAASRIAIEREALSATYKMESEEVATQFESRAADASNRARELGETLSSKVAVLIDRLASSNSKLGQLVELTGKSFIDIDERLAATTDTFGTRAEKAAREISTSVSMLEGNVGRLSDLSSGTLGEVAGIVNKFDEHSRTLQRANELLTAAQSNLQHTLEDRREALDALASGLVTRSKEIETVLGSMSGQIEATLERSENRTRASAATLQSTVTTVFDEATAKFSDATSKLERASSAIREELDNTREELRRGLVDLPAETKQTTDTLRRAVTDQIGALRELADVMTKNARDRDVREPVSPSPRRAAAAVEAVPTYVEQRPTPAQRAVEPQITEKRAPAAEGTGWVKTLLRSATENEDAPVAPRRQSAPARQPNQVINSLNSISVDIARAIDHNQAVDLWERYRRGDRDVFTRRLYTLRGQETFDDIRRKYESDREFRLSVTRYCEDFEKLLSDVSRSDPEGKAAQRYLTSDTGKVYTMLAHASGRLR